MFPVCFDVLAFFVAFFVALESRWLQRWSRVAKLFSLGIDKRSSFHILGVIKFNNQPNNIMNKTNTESYIQLKAYAIAVGSLNKQIEAKRKQQLRTKCANKRFLLEEEKEDLQKLVDEINELRNQLI